MASKLSVALLWALVATIPLIAQDKLYPVRPSKELPGVPILVNSDRSAFVIEKSFQHKTTLGFPSDDRMDYLPETRAPLIVLWLRIQNTSRNPMKLDIAKFAASDDSGKTFSSVASQDAADRMMAGASGSSIGTKALRRVSLGRAGGPQLSADDVKEDILRYSLRSQDILAGGIKEGFIYFEAPQRKKYTFNVSLGDLWSQPLVFSTEKQKK